MYYPKIAGKLCYLSPCAMEDAEYWTRWLNDLEVALPLGDEAYSTIGFERMQAEVSQSIRDRETIFTIVDFETDQPIGRCLLFAMDPVNRSAMLGIFIGEKEFWGRGYGQEATRLLLDYAFNLLNIHSVMLGVFSFNTRGVRAYEKVGFRPIGRRREARMIAGKAYDVIFMDMLETEFRALYPSGSLPLPAEGGE